MLNKIILKGNVGRAPEIKLTQDGKLFATFCLATNLTWRDADGEWQTHTDWHRIAVFRDASIRWIKSLLKSGDAVYVEGRLSYNSWKDIYHQTRITPQIVVENWQGHVEHLRHPRGSFQENDAAEDNLDQKNSQIMEESLADLFPLPSSQRWNDEDKPFFQGSLRHYPLSHGNHSRVGHSPTVEHHFKEDIL